MQKKYKKSQNNFIFVKQQPFDSTLQSRSKARAKQDNLASCIL